MSNEITIADLSRHILHQVKKHEQTIRYIELEAITFAVFVDIVQRHSQHPIDENIQEMIENYTITPIFLDEEFGINIPALTPYYHVYGNNIIRDDGTTSACFKQYNGVIDTWVNKITQTSILDVIHAFKQTPLYLVPKTYPSFINHTKYLLSDICAIDLNKLVK